MVRNSLLVLGPARLLSVNGPAPGTSWLLSSFHHLVPYQQVVPYYLFPTTELLNQRPTLRLIQTLELCQPEGVANT
jgi:hypothetical protein